MKKENIYDIWCRTNAKQMSIEKFKEICKIDFHDFFAENKNMCLIYWNKRIVPKLKKKKVVPQYLIWKKEALKERIIKIDRKIKNIENET